MSNIKNGGLDQYGAEPFEQQQFGTADVEVVNILRVLGNKLKGPGDLYSSPTFQIILIITGHRRAVASRRT